MEYYSLLATKRQRREDTTDDHEVVSYKKPQNNDDDELWANQLTILATLHSLGEKNNRRRKKWLELRDNLPGRVYP